MDQSLNHHVLVQSKHVSKCSGGDLNVTDKQTNREPPWICTTSSYIVKLVGRKFVTSKDANKTLFTVGIVCTFEGPFTYLVNNFSFSSSAPQPM